eukprot:m51a1_g1265 thiamine biosynthesis bifunctional protein (783) ;mRNA; r:66649-69068
MSSNRTAGSDLERVRASRPLVHNITNFVAMSSTANALLAVGASPVMAHAVEEAAEMARAASALVLNMGTLSPPWIESMLAAGTAARERGTPVVLDPVGAGATAYRTAAAGRVLRECRPTVVRGNASEILSLAGEAGAATRGVDSAAGPAPGESAEEALARVVRVAARLAAAHGTVVVVSGETDVVTDGRTVRTVRNGSAMMTRVTAMGCTASALVAAFAAVNPCALDAATHAMALMGVVGELAALRSPGPASLQLNFLDGLYTITPSMLDSLARLGSLTVGDAPQQQAERVERPLPQRQQEGRKHAFDLSVYLVTDRPLCNGRDLEDVVMEAVKGGATMVQLREKDCGTSDFVELAVRLRRRLSPLGVPLVINDRVDVALASDADGVHIGQSDMPYALARSLLGPDKIIGLTVTSVEQAREADALDVDYIGISTFPTQTKVLTNKPLGLEGIREITSLTRHPAVAIGGINADNAASVMRAGANGVAVVSAICSAPDPQQAARHLRGVVDAARSLRTYKRALTIAGSDPSGGAGIQADLKTFSALGCFGTSAITAVVDENTVDVFGVHPIPPEFVQGQVRSVLNDIGADAVKIGMLHSSELVRAVRQVLDEYDIRNVVLDPVMVATCGGKLLEDDAVAALKEVLIPRARLITPNIPEAEILLGKQITRQEELPALAKELSMGGKVSVLLKAGHLSDASVVDVFYNAETDETLELTSQRVNTPNTHGTGCTLSSAVAAFLAQGLTMNDAVRKAKDYISQAIAEGSMYKIGKGHGPVHHFHSFWH